MHFFLRSTYLLFGAVFFAVGIALFAVVAVLVGDDFAAIENGMRAEGVVLAAPDNGTPTIEFRTADGRRVRIQGSITTSPSPYEVGERIGVFYDPQAPEKALIDSFVERWFLPLLFGGFATVFSLIGAAFLLSIVRTRRRRARLLRQGTRLTGQVAGFEQSRTTKINGRRPWHVVVDWTGPSGQPRRERSEMLREDPSTRLKIGDPVPVVADPHNLDLFWIDLEGSSTASVGSGFGGTSGNVSTGVNVRGMGKNGTNPVVRRR